MALSVLEARSLQCLLLQGKEDECVFQENTALRVLVAQLNVLPVNIAQAMPQLLSPPLVTLVIIAHQRPKQLFLTQHPTFASLEITVPREVHLKHLVQQEHGHLV